MSRRVDPRKPLSDKDRKYLEARGLPTDTYPGEAESVEGSEEETVVVETEDDYEEWSPDDLKEELRERKLPVSGNKPALVARLREHDASNPE